MSATFRKTIRTLLFLLTFTFAFSYVMELSARPGGGSSFSSGSSSSSGGSSGGGGGVRPSFGSLHMISVIDLFFQGLTTFAPKYAKTLLAIQVFRDEKSVDQPLLGLLRCHPFPQVRRFFLSRLIDAFLPLTGVVYVK